VDTSELNIKMLEKAKEIQGAWHPEYGDWFYADCAVWTIGDASFYFDMPDENKTYKRRFFPVPSVQCEDENLTEWNRSDIVWIPRQDQLQNMIIEFGAPPISLIGRVVNYEPIPMWMDTWEQFFLVMVMDKLYSKRWNGEDWV